MSEIPYEIPSYRYDSEEQNARVVGTLAYAMGLAGTTQFAHYFKKVKDERGILRVTWQSTHALKLYAHYVDRAWVEYGGETREVKHTVG